MTYFIATYPEGKFVRIRGTKYGDTFLKDMPSSFVLKCTQAKASDVHPQALQSTGWNHLQTHLACPFSTRADVLPISRRSATPVPMFTSVSMWSSDSALDDAIAWNQLAERGTWFQNGQIRISSDTSEFGPSTLNRRASSNALEPITNGKKSTASTQGDFHQEGEATVWAKENSAPHHWFSSLVLLLLACQR